MKKQISVIFLAVLVLLMAGCNKSKDKLPKDSINAPTEAIDNITPIPSANASLDEVTNESSEIWGGVRGSFVREGSSQYNNAVLTMMYLSNNCVMFEFKLMEGSEAEDMAHDTFIPGVFVVDDSGVGFYETDPSAVNPLRVEFEMSEDGQRITVTHTGELVISPDGEYIFADKALEVSASSATAIIEHLPTAATSLNSNIGMYTVNYPESLVAGWFFPVEATFDDTGTVIAKFLVAKDLSAVFRADDDIEPVLIFGTVQPMMDAEYYLFTGNEVFGESGEDEEFAEMLFGIFAVVSVEVEGGISIKTDTSRRLVASLPWNLPYILTARSSDETIVAADENGIITAIAEGEAVISGTVMIEDGVKEFSIDVFVTNELDEETI